MKLITINALALVLLLPMPAQQQEPPERTQAETARPLADSCRAVIAYSLQDQGSIFYWRLALLDAIRDNLAFNDAEAKERLQVQLESAFPSPSRRATVVDRAMVALNVARESPLC